MGLYVERYFRALRHVHCERDIIKSATLPLVREVSPFGGSQFVRTTVHMCVYGDHAIAPTSPLHTERFTILCPNIRA